MPDNLLGRLLSGNEDRRNRNIKIAIVILLFAMGVVLLVIDYMNSSIKQDGKIIRNDYGEGSKVEILEAEIEDESEDERIPLEIEVSERQYSEEETQEMFERIIRKMEKLILGENESLDQVNSDLNLVTEIQGEPVEVSWELDRYDVMNVRGELITEKLTEKSVIVNLKAILTYTEDTTRQALYECAACISRKSLTEQEAVEAEINEQIKEAEESSKSEAVWYLPEEMDGKEVSYYRKMDVRGLVLMVMAVIIAGLLYALQKQNLMVAEREKTKQMVLDYPEIVNKMTLFLGAGMTVKRAWRKIVEDYEHSKEQWGTRYAYEEMKRTSHEMDSGATEAACYENFGQRCNVQMYIRFGALLSQNLRKGTRGLSELLRLESIQAQEERKANAKRLGEEAATKLLLPMFLMLAIVLVIVIVPAFLSVEI
jgi:hypothetical protein